MAKDIIKKRMGRPKGLKDKIAKKQKIQRQLRRIEDIPLTDATLEQQIAALQKELEQRKMKVNVRGERSLPIPKGWTKKAEGDVDIYESPMTEFNPKDFRDKKIIWSVGESTVSYPSGYHLDPPKSRGRSKRHVEAPQQIIDDTQVSQVEKPREAQPVRSETIVNKPFENNEQLRDLKDCDGHYLFKGDEPRSPGRPKGSKNKITLVLEKIGDDNAAEIYQKMVDLALGRSSEGDAYACKFILDRVYPQRKGRRFNVEMRGPVDTPHDINEFSKKVMTLMAEGDISAEEAVDYGRVFEQGMKTMTDTEVVNKIENTCQKVEEIKNGR
jgi:hypothetical protein